MAHRNFLFGLFTLCGLYLLFQCIFIPQIALARDELWFGHHIYQFLQAIPYRDFPPYKTILGYYVLTLPLFFFHDVVNSLLAIKFEIALINVCFLASTVYWSRRFFQLPALLLTILILLTNLSFLTYGTELRTDMLACWIGLVSALLVLSNRNGLAGMMLGISFLFSQKVLWYFAATNIAFLFGWQFRKIIWFNLAVLLTISLYIAYWSWVSSFSTVIHSVFYEAYTQSKMTWYAEIYYGCWQTILLNGPILFMLWPLTWFTLLKKQPHSIFINIYSSVILIFILNYQQPFPYNMIFLFPAFFLGYANLFSLFFNPSQINSRLAFWLCAMTSCFGISLLIIFDLPVLYYPILIIPSLFACWFRFYDQLVGKTFSMLIFIIMVFCGAIVPLIRLSEIILSVNGKYQQYMMHLADTLLAKEDNYFAGTPFLYNKEQAIPGLKNLITPAIEYISHPRAELQPLMLSSLNLDMRSPAEIIHELQTTNVKLYVNSERMLFLPASLRQFLSTMYQPFWGSIYLYAPEILASQQQFFLKFSGNYKIVSHSSAHIQVDHKRIRPNTVLSLHQGTHFTLADRNYRLKLIPEINIKTLDSRYQSEYLIDKPIAI